MYESFSFLFFTAAVISFINYRWIKLPLTIAQLLLSLGLEAEQWPPGLLRLSFRVPFCATEPSDGYNGVHFRAPHESGFLSLTGTNFAGR